MTEINTYYGQPVIKEPVWTWEIPTYFFTGGMAGASAGLAYLSELRGNDVLARRAWAIALGAISTSPALLTSDLGKPTRFINMLRMVKPTSPMSLGSWILTASGATTALAAASEWTGLFPRAGRLAKPAAAVLGLPLSTYTAALIANTAIPVWHEARRTLPFVFASGAALSASAAATIATPPDKAAPARRLALAAAALELGLTQAMEKQLDELAEPYAAGSPQMLKGITRVCLTNGSALLAARGRRSRAAAVLGGGLLCAGALSARWSVFKAGFASAKDPKYVVGPQRARIEARERTGAARRHSTVSEPEPAVGTPANSDSVVGSLANSQG
jgi:Polysulphide reductase, NrfD